MSSNQFYLLTFNTIYSSLYFLTPEFLSVWDSRSLFYTTWKVYLHKDIMQSITRSLPLTLCVARELEVVTLNFCFCCLCPPSAGIIGIFPCTVYGELNFKSRAQCMLGNCSASWSTSPTSHPYSERPVYCSCCYCCTCIYDQKAWNYPRHYSTPGRLRNYEVWD